MAMEQKYQERAEREAKFDALADRGILVIGALLSGKAAIVVSGSASSHDNPLSIRIKLDGE